MTPYLVQRGVFKDTQMDEIDGIDSLIRFDYMGSSEFEWGALPKALNRLMDSFHNLEVLSFSEITDLYKNPMYIICRSHEVEKVKEAIRSLVSDNPPRCKEWVGLREYITKATVSFSTADFWWDIENDWMCCFGDDINRLAVAMNKVYTKKKEKDPENPLPSNVSLQARKKDVQFLDEGKIFILKYMGKDTKIVKRKIKSVDPENRSLVVVNRAGNDRPMRLSLPDLPVADSIMATLKSWEEINSL